jgi:hypothetical protein
MPNLPFKIGRTKTPKVAPIFATPAAKPLAVARNCVGSRQATCPQSRAPKAIAGWLSAASHPVATSAVAVGLLRPMLVLLATV